VKRIHNIAITAVSALLVLAGSCYSIWVAWDRGLVGDNPRAPVAAAMEGAVRKQALVYVMTREAADACIVLDLNHPPPEVMGQPGIAMYSAPGRYAITLLRQTNIRDQPARDIQFGQIDYLVSQGLLSATDGSVDTDDGPRPVRSYQMTWAGFSAIQQNHGSSLCLPYGRREFVGVEKIEKLLEKVMDLDVYEVTYVSRITDIPDWASTVEARRMFPKLPQLIAETKGKAKVIRAREGWRSAYEVEMEAAQIAKGTTTSDYLMQTIKNLERATPSLDEAKSLVSAQAVDVNWVSRTGIACLPLQLQRGGDDKIAPGAVRDAPAFTVTYYDRGDRKEYEYRTMAKALHILSALEGAGLAQMEQIKPLLPIRKANKDASPVSAAQNTGVRYQVSREAVEALGLSGYGGGCVPAGRLKVEALAVRSNRGTVQVVARGIVEQTPEWAAKIGEKLPALKSLIETGLPLSGQMGFAAEKGAGKWRLVGLSPSYPETSYNDIPTHLVPLMPLTVAAFPVKPVKAPTLVPQEFVPPEPTPVPAPAQAPGMVYANALPPAPSTPAQLTPSQPPYSAEDAPVHVVSIYQASLRGGEQRGFQQHPEGVVNLDVNEPDAVLLLFAYEPVEWHISAAKGIALKRVIATGYHEQRVTFAGGGKPQVVTAGGGEILRQSGVNLRNGFPTGRDANDLIDIAAISHALTGALPRSFQGGYEASATSFVIGPQSPRFTLPARQAPDSGGNTVTLRSAFGEAVKGSLLLRGPAGAYTDAWSDRAYSAGRVYYEGWMRVTGALAAHIHANIGLCLVRGNTIETSVPGGTTVIHHGEQKLYKDGDVFGIAADFEQQRLYYHVNGAWVTGVPGSGSGIPLEKGKEYRACLFAASTTSSELQRGGARSDTTWETNFGDRPFSKTIPSGYVPFQGKK